MKTETIAPYRHNPHQPEASSIAARINADDLARKQERERSARAKSQMEDAGWDISVATKPEGEFVGLQERVAQTFAERQAAKKAHRARYKEVRDTGKILIPAIAAEQVKTLAARIKDALPGTYLQSKPLPSLNWQDTPGLIVAEDTNLLFAAKRRREEEWTVTVVQKGKEGEPDILLAQMASSHKSHCEALEYVEGVRAGWYLRAIKKEGG